MGGVSNRSGKGCYSAVDFNVLRGLRGRVGRVARLRFTRENNIIFLDSDFLFSFCTLGNKNESREK